jgi:4-amino-4-deoxy-L-arabinose transferase-like glycosyltransferase
VRLLARLSAAAGSVLLARAADLLHPGRWAGLTAALLLNATLMLGAGAVTMTPDTPLLFFWTAAVWALAHIATGGGGSWWLVAGAAAGLGLDSKYTAALLGLGIGLWLLTPAMRHHLRTLWPWLGGVLAVLLFLPVIVWNAGRHWASFVRQGGRTGEWDPSRALGHIGELIGGQIGLATPLIFILFVTATAAAVRRWRDPAWSLSAALILPGAAVFLQHAAGDRVQANWVAVLYPGAALAAAGAGSRWVRPAAALGFLFTGLLYIQVVLAPLPLPRTVDPTTRLAGWTELAAAAATQAARIDAAYIASEEYGAASLLAWHAGAPPVIGAESRWRLFDLAPATTQKPGLLLLSARRHEPPDPALWLSAEPLGTLVRRRDAMEIETYRLFRVVLLPGAAAVVLPSRHGSAPPSALETRPAGTPATPGAL